MEAWRNACSMAEISDRLESQEGYSVAVLGSGGLLDTIAAVRAGFIPVWGTEVCPKQQRLWCELTSSPNYPDTFKDIPANAYRPFYLKSGQPCPNYTCEGSAGVEGCGSSGSTGWMFVEQGSVILNLKPLSFCLEMTDNAIWIHKGHEVNQLINKLQSEYILHYNLIQLWRHGDPTSRRRMFIVGFHKSLGEHASQFTFPEPLFDEFHAPIAAHIAVPDSEVPDEYWIDQSIDEHMLPRSSKSQKPGDLHLIAQVGQKGEFGSPECPCAVYSWYGLLNAQLTTNGGGRRPPLSWWFDTPLTTTRLTVPKETVAAASLPDDYLQYVHERNSDCECHAYESNDQYVRRCVNNGVPVRTSMSIDVKVMQVLKSAGMEPDVCGTPGGPHSVHEASPDPTSMNHSLLYCLHAYHDSDENDCMPCDAERMPCDESLNAFSSESNPKYNVSKPTYDNWVGLKSKIRCIHVDTMANKTFLKASMSSQLTNARKSRAKIQVANKSFMDADLEGNMPCYIINPN